MFTYNMLRVVKLYDLYCLNASILFEMVPFQVAQAACDTISFCQNLSFRFEIPWCALSCHKLKGENGVGRISSSKAGIVQRNLGFLNELKNMHLVLLICCIVANSSPKNWVFHVQSISHCCLVQLYSGKFSLVQ